jgi:drug/metabolite transporter (DMT)-like permease
MTSKQRSDRAQGYLFAFLGSVCGGAIPTLVKILLADLDPIVLSGFAFLLSGLLLLLYPPRVKPVRKSVPFLLFFGILGAGVAPLMFTYGIAQTTAVNGSLLSNAEILFTAVIAFTFFGERMSRGELARGLLIVAGVVVVSTNLDLQHVAFLQGLAGNLLVLGSVLAWSVENNIIAVATKKFEVSSLSKYRNLIGGSALSAFVLVARVPFGLTTFNTLVLILLALTVAGATYLFIGAVKRIGAVRMLLVWSSSTVFGAVFALVFLGEQVTITQALGGALIISGIYVFHRGQAIPEAEPFAPPAGPASK